MLTDIHDSTTSQSPGKTLHFKIHALPRDHVSLYKALLKGEQKENSHVKKAAGWQKWEEGSLNLYNGFYWAYIYTP